jgi:hypothetical protein
MKKLVQFISNFLLSDFTLDWFNIETIPNIAAYFLCYEFPPRNLSELKIFSEQFSVCKIILDDYPIILDDYPIIFDDYPMCVFTTWEVLTLDASQ